MQNARGAAPPGGEALEGWTHLATFLSPLETGRDWALKFPTRDPPTLGEAAPRPNLTSRAYPFFFSATIGI